jgi:hypothetical protein
MKLGQAFRDQMGGKLGGAVQHEFDLLNAIVNDWSQAQHKDDGTHGDVTSDTLVNAGLTNFGGPWYLPQSAVLTPSQITANQDNYRPTGIDDAIVLRLSTDASRTLTGIYNDDVDTDRWLLLVNVGNFNLVLAHNITSTAEYRFACPGAANLTLASADCALVWYDHSAGNWRIVARATAAASSGVADGDKGDITVSGSGLVWTIDADAVSYAKIQNISGASLLLGRGSAAGAGDVQEITVGSGLTMSGTTLSASVTGGIDQLTGDVTAGPGSGSQAATIAADAVTNAKAANMAQSTIKGRAVGAGTGDPTDLTATQATAILDNLVGDSGSGGTKGLAPAPGSGDAAAGKFLKADATWAAPSGSGASPWSLISTVTLSGASSHNVTSLASYTDIRVLFLDVTFGTSSQTQITVSTDNGSTFLTSSGDYRNIAGNGVLANDTRLLPYSGSHTAARGGECSITGWNLTAPKVSRAVFFSVDSVYLRIIPVASALNALQISASVNFTGGTAYVYGRAA